MKKLTGYWKDVTGEEDFSLDHYLKLSTQNDLCVQVHEHGYVYRNMARKCYTKLLNNNDNDNNNEKQLPKSIDQCLRITGVPFLDRK